MVLDSSLWITNKLIVAAIFLTLALADIMMVRESNAQTEGSDIQWWTC